MPQERQRTILSSLGFEVEDGSARVPSWRRDVEGSADLVEEIARIEGYDRLAATPSTGQPASPGQPQPARSSSSAGSAARPLRAGWTKR